MKRNQRLKIINERKRRVKSGKILSSNLYGYNLRRRIENNKIVKGEREINPEEAKVIQDIFRMFLEGMNGLQISNHLNNNNIPSPRGKKWRSSAIIGNPSRKDGILGQDLYAGTYIYNKLKFVTKNRKRLCVLRPISEWITHSFPELAIIDQVTFDKAQEILKERQEKKIERKKQRLQNKKIPKFSKLEKKEHEIRRMVSVDISTTTIAKMFNVPRHQMDYFIKTRIINSIK